MKTLSATKSALESFTTVPSVVNRFYTTIDSKGCLSGNDINEKNIKN